jgi:hypothetical protein
MDFEVILRLDIAQESKALSERERERERLKRRFTGLAELDKTRKR